jgi:uncharacterized protein YegP (UPF0339 family)
MWRFEVGNTRADKPSWWLYASNNEMVAWAGETFASTYNAQRAASAFKVGAKTARYDVYQDTGGSWRWRAWRGSDKVAASGESFSSRHAAEQAASRVRDNAGGASSVAA